jgi:hypothetical protein
MTTRLYRPRLPVHHISRQRIVRNQQQRQRRVLVTPLPALTERCPETSRSRTVRVRITRRQPNRPIDQRETVQPRSRTIGRDQSVRRQPNRTGRSPAPVNRLSDRNLRQAIVHSPSTLLRKRRVQRRNNSVLGRRKRRSLKRNRRKTRNRRNNVLVLAPVPSRGADETLSAIAMAQVPDSRKLLARLPTGALPRMGAR